MLQLSATETISDQHLADAIACLFSDSIGSQYNTVLRGGGSEPLYQPSYSGLPAVLTFRDDFPASALHEVAHWCIAGPQRLLQEDFGYEYISAPRSPAQQALFFKAEQRTQCLERAFARALGVPFQPSADNLNADLDAFSRSLDAYEPQLQCWLESSSGARAKRFIQQLTGLGIALQAHRGSAANERQRGSLKGSSVRSSQE